MKIRTGFVSNSSSSSFVCIGCKLTPAIKSRLKEKFPKEKTEEGRTEDDWEWLDRITCDQLDLDLIDLDGKYIIGVALADCDNYMENEEYSMAELQKEVASVQKIVGEDVPIKLYMGTSPS